MSSGSISFDRAADIYDQTRPSEGIEQIADLLAAEVRGGDPVLEVGVGTGRVALPLHARGVGLVGMDLSIPMMAKLVEKAGGTPFPLVAADATRMPFPDATFGAAYLVHVLHLIPPWREAIAQIVRVVRRPGIVLVDPGSMSQRGMSAALSKRFAREAGSTLAKLMPGLFDDKKLDAAMAEAGGVLRMLPEMTNTRERRIRDYVEEMAGGIHAFTWGLDEDMRRRAGERTLAWAEERFGSLDTPRRMRWRIAWRAYDLP